MEFQGFLSKPQRWASRLCFSGPAHSRPNTKPAPHLLGSSLQRAAPRGHSSPKSVSNKGWGAFQRREQTLALTGQRRDAYYRTSRENVMRSSRRAGKGIFPPTQTETSKRFSPRRAAAALRQTDDGSECAWRLIRRGDQVIYCSCRLH